MVALKIETFGGMVPAVDDRLLPNTAASHAENTWLYSGAVVGTYAPTLVHTCDSPSTAKVFRIPTGFVDAEHMPDAVWMEFENPDTDVIRSSVVGDEYDRYYWASSNSPPRYNTRERIENGDPPFLLGVPAPDTAPVVTPSGGSSEVTSSRAYVVTWVSAYGEEGPPSPPALQTGKQDDTWKVTLPEPAPADLGTDRNLTKARIYRTVTSDAGEATYFFVAEVGITDTEYNDSASDEEVSANNLLESTAWTPPPSDLQGWVTMPNGMIAGWRDREVWFCEPYRPHAWPAAYTQVVEYPVVGLGVLNQTLVICTQAYPVTASGLNPASITLSKLASIEPCLSRGSILSTIEGVYYASQNGLVRVAQGVAVNITKDLVTKDEWQELTKVSTLRAARLGTAYYAFGSVRQGVFETTAFETTAFTQEDYAGAYRGVLIDPANQRVAFNILSNDLPVANVMNDPWTGEVLIIRDGGVYWIDLSETEPTHEVFKWRSKIFQTPALENLQAMKVFFEVPSTTPAQNPVRNTDLEQELAEDQYGLIRIYADGRLVLTRELRTSGELMRLPSGFKADFWAFELEARVRILSVQMASSAKELRSV